MKATGIVRRIDDLGRVVIPKEIRRTMRIREGDTLQIRHSTTPRTRGGDPYITVQLRPTYSYSPHPRGSSRHNGGGSDR